MGSSPLPSLPWPSDIYPGHTFSPHLPTNLSSSIQERTLAWVHSPVLPAVCRSRKAGGWLEGGREEQRPQQHLDSTHIRTRYATIPLHPPWVSCAVPVKRPTRLPCRVTSTAPASLFPTLAPWPHAVGASPCSVPLTICLPALVSLEQPAGTAESDLAGPG